MSATRCSPPWAGACIAGDEFLLLWPDRPQRPLEDAAYVLRTAMGPLIVQAHTLRPTASLGLALADTHLRGPELISAADHAMYAAKNAGTDGGPDADRVHLYASPYPPPPANRRTSRGRYGERAPRPATDTEGYRT
jgi:GGDEF domain-containing protein